MFNFLQDTVWQFLIGASIAIIAIVVSVILYFKQLNRKRLSYEILSDTSLLTTDEETKNEIRLTYKNEPIEKVRLIVLRIFNSGNVPVESEDYEEPISIRLGDARVLSAEVIKKSPKNLKSTLIIEKGVVTLYPTLLNPADSLKIKILVSDYEKGLEVNSRIIGVKRIELVHESSFLSWSLAAVILTLIIITLGSIAWYSFFGIPLFEAFSLLSIAFYTLMLIALIALFYDKTANEIFNKSFGSWIKGNKAAKDDSECSN